MLQGLALLVQVADGTLSQCQANRKGNIPAGQHKLTRVVTRSLLLLALQVGDFVQQLLLLL